jgi:hypothetical protein
MKFSGRFKSRLEANVGIGGCVSPSTANDTPATGIQKHSKLFEARSGRR